MAYHSESPCHAMALYNHVVARWAWPGNGTLTLGRGIVLNLVNCVRRGVTYLWGLAFFFFERGGHLFGVPHLRG